MGSGNVSGATEKVAPERAKAKYGNHSPGGICEKDGASFQTPFKP